MNPTLEPPPDLWLTPGEHLILLEGWMINRLTEEYMAVRGERPSEEMLRRFEACAAEFTAHMLAQGCTIPELGVRTDS